MVAPSVPHTTSLQNSWRRRRSAATEGAVSAVSATSPQNDSTLKQMSSVRPGGHAADQGPRQRVGRAGAELLGLGMRGHEGLAALAGAGVVGAPRGDLRQGLGQRAEERVALGPCGVGHDHPGRDAVEARVVDEHGGHVLGLVAQLGGRPPARHDDHRRDVAQLGRDRLGQQRARRPPCAVPFGTGAEHDGVVGLVRTGDVHLVDPGVPRQVLAHRGTALDDAQHAGVDQRRQGAAPVRHEVVVDRVGLHHDGLALDEELGEHVAGAERRHVACGQHERRACVRGGSA